MVRLLSLFRSTTVTPVYIAELRNEVALTVTDDFDYCFAENGLTAFKLGKEIASQSFIGYLGEAKYKKLVTFVLHYIADLDIPIKR